MGTDTGINKVKDWVGTFIQNDVLCVLSTGASCCCLLFKGVREGSTLTVSSKTLKGIFPLFVLLD